MFNIDGKKVITVGTGIVTGTLQGELLNKFGISKEIAGIDVAKVGVGLGEIIASQKTYNPELSTILFTAGTTTLAEEIGLKLINKLRGHTTATKTQVATTTTPGYYTKSNTIIA